jgi:hypothetical protein
MKDRILSSRFAKGARFPFRIIKNDQVSILAEIDIDKSVLTAIDSNRSIKPAPPQNAFWPMRRKKPLDFVSMSFCPGLSDAHTPYRQFGCA